MKKLLIGALCGLPSLPTFAVDRWTVGGMSDTAAQIVNVSTIESNGNIKETWTVTVHSKRTDGYDYDVSWRQFNCKTQKMRFTNWSTRKFGGGVVKRFPDSEWFRIEPGTIGAAAFSQVCKKPTYQFGDYNTIEDAAKGFRKFAFEYGIWK